MSVLPSHIETTTSEELSTMASNLNRQTRQIIRGKRTKRSRPSVVTSSSSSGTSTGGEIRERNAYFSVENSEEDEDVANCLIMLAQGGSNGKHDEDMNAKVDRKSFTDAAGSGDGKTELYVYECKTCNRSFPSFQALGGHRASHKKPKVVIATDDKESVANDEEYSKFSKCLQSVNKVHECSICGTEFSSGQALGGHMRRHRSSPTINTSSHININIDEDQKPSIVLELDLNLPAPENDDHFDDSKFQFVFSAPTLVDCHY